jgi:hypothetical protein
VVTACGGSAAAMPGAQQHQHEAKRPLQVTELYAAQRRERCVGRVEHVTRQRSTFSVQPHSFACQSIPLAARLLSAKEALALCARTLRSPLPSTARSPPAGLAAAPSC